MRVGYLDTIVFTVSETSVMTFRNAQQSGQANFQQHARITDKALPEFTGVALETLTFDMRLSLQLSGKDPRHYVERIEMLMESGRPVYFSMGKQPLGYKWLVQKFTAKYENYDREGNLTDVDIQVTLLEYPRR